MKKIRKEEASDIFDFDNFKNKFEFDPCNLALVAEKYVLASKKIRVLEEEMKKLKQNNNLLAEKNEFGKFLQLELTKKNENEETMINSSFKIDDNNKYKNKNNKNIKINKIKDTMTNNTNINENNKNVSNA